jgi:TIGR03009 family protein
MANRIYLLASLATAIVFCAADASFAQGEPGARQYQSNGANPSGYQNAYPDRSTQSPDNTPQQQQQSRPDAPRGTAAPQNPPAPPFQLTQQEQIDLDKILDAWEKQNGQIKTFKCDFERLKYDPVFFPPKPGGQDEPISTSKGEIQYSAPDKGLLHETEVRSWTLNPKKLVTSGDGEHWACDGHIIYIVDHKQNTVEEIPIPPDLQGQSITQGPLPFVFGAKASELKARYYIRPITPADSKGEAWLEIMPKYQRDAANFSKVKMILETKNMFPSAIQIYGTNGMDRDVFLLTPQGFNLWKFFSPDTFSPEPRGFKIIQHQPQGPPAPQPSGQAQRLAPEPGRR